MPREDKEELLSSESDQPDDIVIENAVTEEILNEIVETPQQSSEQDKPNGVTQRSNEIIVELPREGSDYTVRKSRQDSDDSHKSSSLGIRTLEGGRFDAYSKVSLSWQNIGVNVEITSGGCCKKSESKTVEILKNVSGIVEPGQFMAIMGASGAGKTTLLNTLAFRNEPKLKCTGNINVNGLPISKSQMKLISAYVQQEDYFIGTLTVREVMQFHANLRMDKRVPQEQKQKKVEDLISKLGLTKVADTLCGLPNGAIRGISGGERKRLSVATELLMDPPLLFIDEPTSGLDSFMAESIVKLIRKLSLANRTILCTIHQPTSEVFALFDRVCLVTEGEVAFMGETKGALELFSDAGHPCPNNFNPADHYIFTLAIRPGEEERCKKKCKEISGYYERSGYFKAIQEKISSVIRKADKSTKDVSRKKVQSSLFRQVGENFKRSFKNTVRNPGYTRSRIGQCIILALLSGLAYFKTSNKIDPTDQQSIATLAQNKSGVIFFLVITFTFGNVFIQCLTIPMELPVVKREYQNGMYTTVPYFLSKIITELPYLVALPALQLGISYFMIGLREEVLAFLTCVACCICIAWASTGLGWFIAATTGDLRIASAISAPIIMPFFLFGGLFQSDSATPVYFEPIKWVSWFRYGYHMLMVNELKDLTLDCGTVKPCPNGTIVLKQFSINPDELWWPNIAALLIFGGTLCIFAWSCLLCRVRR